MPQSNPNDQVGGSSPPPASSNRSYTRGRSPYRPQQRGMLPGGVVIQGTTNSRTVSLQAGKTDLHVDPAASPVGRPSNRTFWIVLGGAAAVVVGILIWRRYR